MGRNHRFLSTLKRAQFLNADASGTEAESERIILTNHARTLVIELPVRYQELHADGIITCAEAVIHIKLVCLHDLLTIDLDTETHHLIDVMNASTLDLPHIRPKSLHS